MSIKKKMGMGIATGALGLALVGGGSFAAFNDVEAIDNTFAAGTLNLTMNEDAKTMLDLENLKPGDYIKETITLGNGGSLDIKDILATVSADGHEDVTHSNLDDNGVNSKEDFLKQFTVQFTYDGTELLANKEITLNDLVKLDNVNLTEIVEGPILATGASKSLDVKVTFKDDDTRYPDSKLYTQNKFQGESANIHITFEATQMPGGER